MALLRRPGDARVGQWVRVDGPVGINVAGVEKRLRRFPLARDTVALEGVLGFLGPVECGRFVEVAAEDDEAALRSLSVGICDERASRVRAA